MCALKSSPFDSLHWYLICISFNLPEWNSIGSIVPLLLAVAEKFLDRLNLDTSLFSVLSVFFLKFVKNKLFVKEDVAAKIKNSLKLNAIQVGSMRSN